MQRGPYNVDHHVWNYETGRHYSRTPRIVVSVKRLVRSQRRKYAYRSDRRKKSKTDFPNSELHSHPRSPSPNDRSSISNHAQVRLRVHRIVILPLAPLLFHPILHLWCNYIAMVAAVVQISFQHALVAIIQIRIDNIGNHYFLVSVSTVAVPR